MGTGFEVVAYSIRALKDLLRRPGGGDAAFINRKIHAVYFEEYFDKLGAKTIVVESEYIDRDYLEDFASYYVRCFDGYDKKCCRLHFFDSDFKQSELDGLLEGAPGAIDEKVLQQHYLGFIVVKPLPQTVVGRTCLRTYPLDGRRRLVTTRDYGVNLAGIRLSVNTLAFQEQDSVVAACATSALWSAFHSTGKLFQHHIPTPVAITRAATENEPSDSRNFPNHGLQPTQIARAIRAVGLEPFLVSAEDPGVLRSTVYGYLSGKVPLILAFALFDDEDEERRWKPVGLHGVAVTGFSLGWPTVTPEDGTGFLLESTRIDKLYVHDDGVGPFARLLMDEKSEVFRDAAGNEARLWSMHTSWRRSRTGELGMRAVPTLLMAPLYSKIRIPYEFAEKIIREFDGLLAPILQTLLGDRPTWSIGLAVGGDLKSEVIQEGQLRGAQRRVFLEKPLPRFVWRATARWGGQPALDVILDATDVEQGDLVVAIIPYDGPMAQVAIAAAGPALAPIAVASRHLVQRLASMAPSP